MCILPRVPDPGILELGEHCEQRWPGNQNYAGIDIFRFDDDGEIVEQWDALQVIPETSRNSNTMFCDRHGRRARAHHSRPDSSTRRVHLRLPVQDSRKHLLLHGWTGS